MRSLTSDALTKVAQRLGNEPINIIAVQWGTSGSPILYADRTVDSIPGKILDLATLDNVVNVSGNGQSAEIQVTLDDTDGSLKAILDTNDVHQRAVWVYQTFEGLDLADKFLLFKGQVSSPITYSEGERKLTFNVVTKLEVQEIGFSASDGNFSFVANELIGKAWPMDFGTVIQGETLRLTSVNKGILAKSIGVADFALPYRRDALHLIANFWFGNADTYAIAAEKHKAFSEFYTAHALTLDPVVDAARISTIRQLADGEARIYDTYHQNADQFRAQATTYATNEINVNTIYNQQLAAQPSSIVIIGGEKFPRGNLQLKVADTVIKGSFVGSTNEFHVTQLIHPKANKFVLSSVPIETGALSSVTSTSVVTALSFISALTKPQVGYYVLFTSGAAIGQSRRISAYNPLTGRFTFDVPLLNLPAINDTIIVINEPPIIQPHTNGTLEVSQFPGAKIRAVSLPDTRLAIPVDAEGAPIIPSLPLEFALFDDFPPQIMSQYSLEMFGENAGYVFTEAGTVVEIFSPEGQEYIVSIVPGTVLQVSAFLTKNGVKKLVTVPAEYYSVISRDYGGGLTAVVLTLSNALSKNSLGEWGDDLFVTFQSDVGPNTVDVLQYLIETYTDLSVDSASFAAVHTALVNYPSSFQITERKQILQALSEIAFQARCAIWLSNDVFYLRYLPAEPDSVSTFTDSDVDFGTMEMTFTPTESLVTKMVCSWKATGAQPEANQIILHANAKKYGIKEREFNFYIYNAVDFVLKSATFWLIRYSNTWKTIKFKTPLHKLNVESLDGVTLDFNKPWVSSSAVVGTVEQANYDSASKQLAFQIWTPIRAGEMTPYDFAHPAGIDQTLRYPTLADEELEFDTAASIGKGFELGIPGDFTAVYTNPDFYKMEDRLFNDRGQPHPSDLHDGPPGAPVVQSVPSLTFSAPAPASPLTNNNTPTVQIAHAPVTSGTGTSDTEITFATKIKDNTDPDNPRLTTLADILKFDTVSGIHGARLAYLYAP